MMNCRPIILRELRAEARRRLNYSIRLLSGAAVIVLFAFPIAVAGTKAGPTGSALFEEISRAVFFGIWIIVPFLTADCLSKEKREGTLGLLFLTLTELSALCRSSCRSKSSS